MHSRHHKVIEYFGKVGQRFEDCPDGVDDLRDHALSRVCQLIRGDFDDGKEGFDVRRAGCEKHSH